MLISLSSVDLINEAYETMILRLRTYKIHYRHGARGSEVKRVTVHLFTGSNNVTRFQVW